MNTTLGAKMTHFTFKAACFLCSALKGILHLSGKMNVYLKWVIYVEEM